MSLMPSFLVNEPTIIGVAGPTGAGKTAAVLKALDHAYILTPNAANLMQIIDLLGVTDIVPRSAYTGTESFVYDTVVDIEFRPPHMEQRSGRGLLNYLAINKATGLPVYIPKGFTNVVIDDFTVMANVSKADAAASSTYDTKSGGFDSRAMFGDLKEGVEAVQAAILKLGMSKDSCGLGISTYITGHLHEPERTPDGKTIVSAPNTVSFRLSSRPQAILFSSILRQLLVIERDPEMPGHPWKLICPKGQHPYLCTKDVYGVIPAEAPLNLREPLLAAQRNMPRHKRLTSLDAWVDQGVERIKAGATREDLEEWLSTQEKLTPQRRQLIIGDAHARAFYKGLAPLHF